MNRFWLCAVTILSMCSLSSKLIAFVFASLSLLECTYVAVIQFIIQTSKTFFKKMRENIVPNSSADPRPWGMGPPYNDLYEEASP